MVRARKQSSSDSISTTPDTSSTEHVYVPAASEVLSAVVSLYDDQLKPYSRIMRKRLVERAEARGSEGKDCDSVRLRSLCESFPLFRIEVETGGEWSALLLDRVADFIDIYNPVDNYSEEFWLHAAEYFKRLGQGSDASLPGGRYASAKALANRDLPFLRGYTLGQICHIAQIAISQRKLLGYASGAVVPYEHSTLMLKSRCAKEYRLVDGDDVAKDSDGFPYTVADWALARTKMKDLLISSARRGSDYVPLSNVKRLFRSLFHMELSETSLGHSKLTDLLQDERFADICRVQLRSQGYVVVAAHSAAVLDPAAAADVSQHRNSTRIGCEPPNAATGPDSVPACVMAPLMVHWLGFVPYNVGGQKIEVAVAKEKAPTLLDLKHNNRLASKMKFEKKDSRRAQHVLEKQQPRAAAMPQVSESKTEAIGIGGPKPRSSVRRQQDICNRIQFCPDEPLCVEEAGLAVASGNSSAYPCPSPLPTLHQRFEDTSECATPNVSDTPARVLFCPDEPLCMEEAFVNVLPARSPGFPLPTPSPSPHYPSASLTPNRKVWEAKCQSMGLQLGSSKSAVEEEDCLETRTKMNLERVRFCPDEPLCMEDAERSTTLSPGFPLPTPSPSPMYPSSSMQLDKKMWETNLISLGLVPLKTPEPVR